MTALTRFFFRPELQAAPDTTWQIIGWWESRRLVYNAVLGVGGLFSIGKTTSVLVLPPYSMVMPIPLMPVIVHGIMANIFYCAGPLADLIVNRAWGSQYSAVGAALFRYGFAFSVGLTLLPVPIAFFIKMGHILS